MKVLSVGDELLHADERTDGYDEANSRLPKFYENLKTSSLFCLFGRLQSKATIQIY